MSDRARTFALDQGRVLGQLESYAARVSALDERVLAVLLFGSLAAGMHTGRSDADVMIILSESHEPFIDRPVRFMDGSLDVPLDVVVYTRQEVDDAVARGSGLASRAVRTCVPLFVRPGYTPPSA